MREDKLKALDKLLKEPSQQFVEQMKQSLALHDAQMAQQERVKKALEQQTTPLLQLQQYQQQQNQFGGFGQNQLGLGQYDSHQQLLAQQHQEALRQQLQQYQEKWEYDKKVEEKKQRLVGALIALGVRILEALPKDLEGEVQLTSAQYMCAVYAIASLAPPTEPPKPYEHREYLWRGLRLVRVGPNLEAARYQDIISGAVYKQATTEYITFMGIPITPALRDYPSMKVPLTIGDIERSTQPMWRAEQPTSNSNYDWLPPPEVDTGGGY